VPLSASGDVWDAIIGMRGIISLGDRWFVPWGANIGAGDSDLTWQAMTGVGFKASSWADIALTYRYLKWELDTDLVDDLSFSGPMLGVIFRF
jgi:opacity protein-like surface antigen